MGLDTYSLLYLPTDPILRSFPELESTEIEMTEMQLSKPKKVERKTNELK